MAAGSEPLKRRIKELKSDPNQLQVVRELEHILGKMEKRKSLSNSHKEPTEEKRVSPSDSDMGNGSLFASRSQSPEVPLQNGLPTIPTGSEISEVVVQGKSDDSSESSSSDEDEDDAEEGDGKAADLPAPTLSLPQNPTESDLEVLLRGPPSSLNVANILNNISAKGDDSSESGDSEAEDMASEEEAKHERAFRRMSQQLQRRAPSSDEEDSDEEQSTPTNSVPMDVDQDAEVPSSTQVRNPAARSAEFAITNIS